MITVFIEPSWLKPALTNSQSKIVCTVEQSQLYTYTNKQRSWSAVPTCQLMRARPSYETDLTSPHSCRVNDPGGWQLAHLGQLAIIHLH